MPVKDITGQRGESWPLLPYQESPQSQVKGASNTFRKREIRQKGGGVEHTAEKGPWKG